MGLDRLRNTWKLCDHILEDVMNLLDQLDSIVVQSPSYLVVYIVEEMLRISLEDSAHFLASEPWGEVFDQLWSLVVQAFRGRA